MTDAEKKGNLQQFSETSDHIVGYGRNAGKRLGDLGRRTIYGYAFLTPTKAQCEEALEHLSAAEQAAGRERPPGASGALPDAMWLAAWRPAGEDASGDLEATQI
jgi:hypothetical protein